MKLSLVVLNDTLRCWQESSITQAGTAASPNTAWPAIPRATLAKLLEVCGDVFSMTAEKGVDLLPPSAARGTPAATTGPVLSLAEFSALMQFLEFVDSTLPPLPRMCYSSVEQQGGAVDGPKHWAGIVRGFGAVAQLGLSELGQMITCLSFASDMPLKLPADLTAVDVHYFASYCHWHALACMEAAGTAKSDADVTRVLRRLGFNLNVIGRAKQAAGQHVLAVQLFAWALWTFVESAGGSAFSACVLRTYWPHTNSPCSALLRFQTHRTWSSCCATSATRFVSLACC